MEEKMQKTKICIEDDDADTIVAEQEFSDRSGLDIVQNTASRQVTAPQEPDESSSASTVLVLKKIWQDSLRVDHIEPSDDFFELGGDSLTAIRMLVCVDKEYGEGLLEPDIIYRASRFDDFAKAVTDALAQRTSQ
jgi:acyl carrier protein